MEIMVISLHFFFSVAPVEKRCFLTEKSFSSVFHYSLLSRVKKWIFPSCIWNYPVLFSRESALPVRKKKLFPHGTDLKRNIFSFPC
ncbi:hypothetical protein [Angelakisella massiliensis]|uniref:hypothetical protein n=1 Tax=Angelakisella massiliensis TaxID=1871018 RepID=UPI0023A7AEEE|nr:hypothetical protein [Angelakisella massiliensis]